MAQTPTRKPSKKKRSPRKHIPALDEAQLAEALDRVQALSIPGAAKAQLEAMLRAASNPDAERPEVVLKTLERERQQNVRDAQLELSTFFDGIGTRGRAALEAMSEAEWQALLSGD